MARYIDAEWLMKQWDEPRNWLDQNQTLRHYTWFNTVVSLAPTADVVERKKGKWIWMGEQGDSRFMCSVCKSKEDVPTCNGKPTIWWYCPNCGADMRKETEDE